MDACSKAGWGRILFGGWYFGEAINYFETVFLLDNLCPGFFKLYICDIKTFKNLFLYIYLLVVSGYWDMNSKCLRLEVIDYFFCGLQKKNMCDYSGGSGSKGGDKRIGSPWLFISVLYTCTRIELLAQGTPS